MTTPTFPRRSDDAIAADAVRYRGDTEKVATTPITFLEWEGVRIASRYRKAHELETMAEMVNHLGADAVLVTSIWCDSKAGSYYTVKMAAAANIADVNRIAAALQEFLPGYNGLDIELGWISLSLGPDWKEQAS